MSVITQEVIETFPWGGGLQPGWPIGTWRWDAVALGDASAGVRELDIVIQSALSGQPLTTNLYNIEQLALFDGDNNAKNCRMSVLTLGKHNVVQRWVLELLSATDVGAALSIEHAKAVRGLFWGGQSVAGVSAVVAIDVDNVDGQNFGGVAMGYIWEGSVNNVPGGPVRPVPSLWP